jgi:hypothetical protein
MRVIMKPGFGLIACVSLLTLLYCPAASQEPIQESPSVSPTVASVLADLGTGTTVRLSALGRTTSGRYVRLTAGGVVLTDLSTGAESLVEEQIDTIWVHRPATGRGARIGALIGGVLLGGWVFAFSESDCDFACAAPFAAGIGLAGAGVGALVGAGSGAQIRLWRRLYP